MHAVTSDFSRYFVLVGLARESLLVQDGQEDRFAARFRLKEDGAAASPVGQLYRLPKLLGTWFCSVAASPDNRICVQKGVRARRQVGRQRKPALLASVLTALQQYRKTADWTGAVHWARAWPRFQRAQALF